MINYVNDDRFSTATLKFLVNELNTFVVSLGGKVADFATNHFKNPDILKNAFSIRMVTTSNDCYRLRECFLNIRDKYDKYLDKDEVGGPNDPYETLGTRIKQVSEHW